MNTAFQKALFEGKIPRARGATIKNVRVRQPAKNSPKIFQNPKISINFQL